MDRQTISILAVRSNYNTAWLKDMTGWITGFPAGLWRLTASKSLLVTILH